MKNLIGIVLLSLLLGGCFRPAIPFALPPDYPVDVFFDNQRPEQSFVEIRTLEYSDEQPLAANQKVAKGGRMLKRGITQEEKEILLAKMTLEAKKIGADALVKVRYQYYSTVSMNGWRLQGVAVKYQ